MAKANSLIILQYDWEDVLWKLEGNVWVSYKVKDEKSVQGKLRCTQITANGLPKLASTNGFHVEKISKECLQLRYKDDPYTTTFVAASKVYSGIHKKGITALSVSPKGYSVSVCKDNQMLVWDFNQGELKSTLTGHVGDVYKCKFFPSGEVLLSGGGDMRLRIWCIHTGRCPVTLVGHSMAVTDFDFIDRGKNVLSVSKDGVAKLWCCASASCIGDVAKLSSIINCCQVNVAPPCITLPPPLPSTSEEEEGTENKIALLGCEDGNVHIVAIQARTTLASLTCDSAVNSVAFLTSSLFVAGCQSGQIYMYDMSNLKSPVKSWFESNSAVLSIVRYQEDGFFSSHADGDVIYRNVNQDSKRVALTGPNCDPVYDLYADDKFVYTCCRDALIRRYTVNRVINDQ